MKGFSFFVSNICAIRSPIHSNDDRAWKDQWSNMNEQKNNSKKWVHTFSRVCRGLCERMTRWALSAIFLMDQNWSSRKRVSKMRPAGSTGRRTCPFCRIVYEIRTCKAIPWRGSRGVWHPVVFWSLAEWWHRESPWWAAMVCRLNDDGNYWQKDAIIRCWSEIKQNWHYLDKISRREPERWCSLLWSQSTAYTTSSV